jgi:hypothetical protein
MGFFKNINQDGVNDLLDRMDQFTGIKYPSKVNGDVRFAKGTENSQTKVSLCFLALFAWQHETDFIKYLRSNSLLSADSTYYNAYLESRQELRSVRKRLSQLVIHSLDPVDQKKLGEKVARTWCARMRIPLREDQEDAFGQSLLRFSADDPLCCISIAEAGGLPYPYSYQDPFDPGIAVHRREGDELPDPLLIAAVGSVAKRIPIAPNCWRSYQPAISLTTFSPEKWLHAERLLGEYRGRSNIQYLSKGISSLFIFERICGKNAREVLVGLCDEYVHLLFRELIKKRRVDWKIDKCAIRGGSHTFILVTITRGNNIQSYILDAWNGGKIFPFEFRHIFLQDWRGMNPADGTPILAPFDPASQQIHVTTSNFSSPEEFQQRSTMPLPQIVQLLEEFEQPFTERASKMQIASTLIRTIEELPLSTLYLFWNPALQDLLEQMRYLTKKERIPVVEQRIDSIDAYLINTALKNRDLEALKRHLQSNERSDAYTFLYALDAASRTQNMAFLRLIVEKGVRVMPCELLCPQGQPPEEIAYYIALSYAIRLDNLELLRLATKAGARPDENAFHLALSLAQSGRLALFRMVMEHSPIPPHWNAFQKTLYFALEAGKNEPLRIVAEAGVQPYPEAFRNAFIYALTTGHYEPLRITLAAGAVPYPEAFREALDCALATGRYELLRMIAAAGGQPDFEAYDKAFSFALRTGNREPFRIITDILENK